jgi:transcriptional regulator with XRE-family HTH domain
VSEFSSLLREHRLAAGLNQSELAYLIDCDQTHVGRMERGAREPSRRAVLALALVLDLATSQTDRLLFAAGYRPLTDYQALWERLHGKYDPRMKWCPRCEQAVSVSLFSERHDRPDGLAGYCRPCKAAYTAEHQKKIALRKMRRSA